MLDQKAITATKNTIIEHLRGFLFNVDNYKSIVNRDFSNAMVYDKEPTVLRQFPAILITAMSGNYITSGLGDVSMELYDEYGDFYGYRYSGMFELPITIELATKTTVERDILVDLVSMALRVLLRRHLESKGILVKDMRYGGEGEIQYDSDKIYIATLNLTTWSEWYRDVTALPLTGIDVDINYNK